MPGSQIKHGVAVTFPDGKERLFLLSAPTISVGRGKGNQIVIPCNTVSTKHCAFQRKSANRSSYEIVDLGSTNGTHLNDEAIAENDGRELRDGDKFKIGLSIVARFFCIEEIAEPKNESTGSIPGKLPTVEEVAGAVTQKLKDDQKKVVHAAPKMRDAEPSINPVAAAVARASRGE